MEEEISQSETRPSRTQRYAERARIRRMELVIALSRKLYDLLVEVAWMTGGAPPRPLEPECGRCARCGRDLHPSVLEVDHVDGRSWDMHRPNRWTRVARMWREFEAGVRLRALCRTCNALGGGRRYGRSR